MLRMNCCDLSWMEPSFYPLLMCKEVLLCFHRIFAFTIAEWVLLCRHKSLCSSSQTIWLLTVLPKFSFDWFACVSQGYWLTLQKPSLSVWGSVFESWAQVKILRAEVLLSGIYRQGCTCGNVLWALWLNGECMIPSTKQASFCVLSAGDSSHGKDVFQSTLPANRRRQYWKLIIYKYLISRSTFISGNCSYFSYQGTTPILSLGFGCPCVLKSDFHNFRDLESSLNSWYRSGGVMVPIHPFYQIMLVSWSHTYVWLKSLLLVGLLVVVKPSVFVCV